MVALSSDINFFWAHAFLCADNDFFLSASYNCSWELLAITSLYSILTTSSELLPNTDPSYRTQACGQQLIICHPLVLMPFAVSPTRLPSDRTQPVFLSTAPVFLSIALPPDPSYFPLFIWQLLFRRRGNSAHRKTRFHRKSNMTGKGGWSRVGEQSSSWASFSTSHSLPRLWVAKEILQMQLFSTTGYKIRTQERIVVGKDTAGGRNYISGWFLTRRYFSVVISQIKGENHLLAV